MSCCLVWKFLGIKAKIGNHGDCLVFGILTIMWVSVIVQLWSAGHRIMKTSVNSSPAYGGAAGLPYTSTLP